MSRTTNGKKRRAPSNATSAPPLPPQSLVNLLRSDKDALEYFTSLQTNLDADVTKWRNRSQHYQNECKDLRRQLKQAQEQSPPPRKRQVKSSDGRSQQQVQRRKPEITKDMSEDSEEIASAQASVDNGKRSASEMDEHAVAFSSDADDESVHQKLAAVEEDDVVPDWTVYEHLLEAYSDLRQLGVSLVVEEVIETKDSNVSNEEPTSATNGDKAEAETKLIRRSDHDVAADLMHAFHMLTRIQLQMKDPLYPPFSTDDLLIPCCNVDSHPANKGKECALKALGVMDVYCAAISDSHWNKLFPPESADEAVRVGMRDRRNLVDKLLSSLSGEICETWAVADRSSRLTTVALQYEPSPYDEVIPFAGSFGAKSQVRLSALAERCLLAELVSNILRRRGEHQTVATILMKHILSTAPAFSVEDYPRLAPVLSLCVLDSLLIPYSGTELLSLKDSNSSSSFLYQALALAAHGAACVWKLRLASPDERIHDMSRVELAAFSRLRQSQSFWLMEVDTDESLNSFSSKAKILLEDTLKHARTFGVPKTGRGRADILLASQLALVITGDYGVLARTCRKAVEGGFKTGNAWIVPTCCSAFRQMQVRQLEAFRVKQRSLVESSQSTGAFTSEHLKILVAKLRSSSESSLEGFETLLQCYSQLSDAEFLYETILMLGSRLTRDSDHSELATMISHFLGSPFDEISAPIVRVINLKRRPDRMGTFEAQAQSERILVSKAVARLDVDDDKPPMHSLGSNILDTAKYVWSMHALDGKGGMVEVVSRLSEAIGESHELSDFVHSHWRPNDLKAFDKDARSDDKMVALSPSECACALSHIASWKGVYRSLRKPFLGNQEGLLEGLAFPFLISGYARGRPLLHINENMPPTPVCVILEDDAILVDRFADRLSTILEELPRDFHFCSIGYSRPKTAPMAMFSTHLGIPSCIWYLTGYILSLDGAKHLLDALPVRGPVDSWIGLKMCTNWDNVFGQAMGVGARAAGAPAEPPSRKDLTRILQFRAFAALVPLCSQKVDTTTNTTVGRSWRQRDTDITYSGNL